MAEPVYKYTLPMIIKAVIALGLAAATAFGTMVLDGEIELIEVAGFVGAIITAWGVFKARNAAGPPAAV